MNGTINVLGQNIQLTNVAVGHKSLSNTTGSNNTAFGYNSMPIRAPFVKIDQSLVDSDTWFTISCNKEIGAWMRTQPASMWYEHIDKNWILHKNTFDIHEKLYTLLQLKWS